jgi:hypothetical protein
MRAKEFLIEAGLTPAEIFGKHLGWRPDALIAKLKAKTPFVDSLNQEVANKYNPAPGEFQRLEPLITAAKEARLENPNAAVPSLVLNYKSITRPDGTTEKTAGSISFSKLEKYDLQTAKGQATTDVNVQPLGIGIAAPKVDKSTTTAEEIKTALDANSAIKGSDLYDVIANNQVLSSAGPLGAAIKQAAEEISNFQIPDLSKYDEKTQKVMAIDAGEYLGILMMVYGMAEWSGNKYDKFLKFLGATDLSELLVIFPGSQNSQLQDSYGVQNTATGHTIMISSKGGIGSTAVGAAPALSGLKIPARMKKAAQPGSAVDFIQLMQGESMTTINQPFYALNFLNQYYPDSIPEMYKAVLPFTDADIASINANIKGRGDLDPKFNTIIQSRKVKSRARAGGILFYAAAKDLVESFNSNQPIPDFRQTVLKILDMNFVQIFTRVVGKKLTANVLWPGNIDGNVLLWTKAEAASPSSAGLSFKVTD